MWLLQMRYAAGTKDVLDRFFNNKPLKKDDVIVEVRHLDCHSACAVACFVSVVARWYYNLCLRFVTCMLHWVASSKKCSTSCVVCCLSGLDWSYCNV